MSPLQTARNEADMRITESQRPLVLRTDSTEDDCSLEASSPADTDLSEGHTTLPKSIDWSLTYSSDEESQKQIKRSRSHSEPGLEIAAMRRRPRSLTFDLRAPFSAPAGAREDENKNPSHRRRFTPMIGLAALFLISCYTTFWLPYPEIPPATALGGLRNNYHGGAPQQSPPLLSVPQQQHHSVLMRGGGDVWMHARVERFQETLIYRKEDDPLSKFYQQEAFTTRSYTKEANIAMLVVVSLWAVWERRHHRKVQLE
mmetsp:Transcript_7727/g.15491  ORF Transcript_7727/g.15491 Transcript_7727/m.15491 type:complete len:257 (-) Transcript_7727:61-831(-)